MRLIKLSNTSFNYGLTIPGQGKLKLIQKRLSGVVLHSNNLPLTAPHWRTAPLDNGQVNLGQRPRLTTAPGDSLPIENCPLAQLPLPTTVTLPQKHQNDPKL